MSAGKFMKQAAERDYSQWWQKPGTFPWMFQQEKPPLPKLVTFSCSERICSIVRSNNFCSASRFILSSGIDVCRESKSTCYCQKHEKFFHRFF